jgi:hypothetical protein
MMSDDERLIRWHVVVHYRTENGAIDVEHNQRSSRNCTT